MFGLLTILFLISIILFVIGIIRPSIIKISSRKKTLKLGGIVLTVLFILMIITVPDLTEEERADLDAREQAKEEQVQKAEAEKEKEKEDLKKKEEVEAEKEKEKEDIKKKEEAEAEKEKEKEDIKKKEEAEAEKEKEKEDIKKKEEAEADKKKEKENLKKKEEAEADKKKEKEDIKKKEKVEADKKKEANVSMGEKLTKKYDAVRKAELKENGTLNIYLDDDFSWNENTLTKNHGRDALDLMKIAFTDDKVQAVNTILIASMTDVKGNESESDIIEILYSRKSFEELNYKKFKEMATLEAWRVYNESDEFIIAPGIYKNLKDDMTNNLNY